MNIQIEQRNCVKCVPNSHVELLAHEGLAAGCEQVDGGPVIRVGNSGAQPRTFIGFCVDATEERSTACTLDSSHMGVGCQDCVMVEAQGDTDVFVDSRLERRA